MSDDFATFGTRPAPGHEDMAGVPILKPPRECDPHHLKGCHAEHHDARIVVRGQHGPYPGQELGTLALPVIVFVESGHTSVDSANESLVSQAGEISARHQSCPGEMDICHISTVVDSHLPFLGGEVQSVDNFATFFTRHALFSPSPLPLALLPFHWPFSTSIDRRNPSKPKVRTIPLQFCRTLVANTAEIGGETPTKQKSAPPWTRFGRVVSGGKPPVGTEWDESAIFGYTGPWYARRSPADASPCPCSAIWALGTREGGVA